MDIKNLSEKITLDEFNTETEINEAAEIITKLFFS